MRERKASSVALIECRDLSVTAENRREILSGISFSVDPGDFVAVLGENGAGKTTLLDTVMGFRKPGRGALTIDGQNPADDNHEQRQGIAYLSEKVDMPADWTVRDFLEFNRYFYPAYRTDEEARLAAEWGLRPEQRIVNLSAGEIRRVQIVAALCQGPRLLVIDEISAVLDIVGRRRFMAVLSDLNRTSGATILFATNILEDLQGTVTRLLILRQGRLLADEPLSTFMERSDAASLSDAVARRIETP